MRPLRPERRLPPAGERATLSQHKVVASTIRHCTTSHALWRPLHPTPPVASRSDSGWPRRRHRPPHGDLRRQPSPTALSTVRPYRRVPYLRSKGQHATRPPRARIARGVTCTALVGGRPPHRHLDAAQAEARTPASSWTRPRHFCAGGTRPPVGQCDEPRTSHARHHSPHLLSARVEAAWRPEPVRRGPPPEPALNLAPPHIQNDVDSAFMPNGGVSMNRVQLFGGWAELVGGLRMQLAEMAPSARTAGMQTIRLGALSQPMLRRVVHSSMLARCSSRRSGR
jgi:hypothetical protein